MYASKYGFGQPCLTLLASCMKVTYDNFNITRLNEELINNFFATTLQLLLLIIINI